MRVLRTLPPLLLAGFTAGAAALSTDPDQPVRIVADSALLDDAEGIAVYRGNVAIRQGSLLIEGDVVTMYFDRDRDLSKLVAEGESARFQQQPEGGGPLQRATADRIEYYLEDDTMILIGNARLARGGDEMQAERIFYDTANAMIKGGPEGAGGTGRVTITVTPSPDKEEEKTQ